VTSKSLFDAHGNGWMIFEGLRLKLRSDVFVPRGESRHLVHAATRRWVKLDAGVASYGEGTAFLKVKERTACGTDCSVRTSCSQNI